MRSLFKRYAAAGLAAALLIASPGLPCYEAAAGVAQSNPKMGAINSAPVFDFSSADSFDPTLAASPNLKPAALTTSGSENAAATLLATVVPGPRPLDRVTHTANADPRVSTEKAGDSASQKPSSPRDRTGPAAPTTTHDLRAAQKGFSGQNIATDEAMTRAGELFDGDAKKPDFRPWTFSSEIRPRARRGHLAAAALSVSVVLGPALPSMGATPHPSGTGFSLFGALDINPLLLLPTLAIVVGFLLLRQRPGMRKTVVLAQRSDGKVVSVSLEQVRRAQYHPNFKGFIKKILTAVRTIRLMGSKTAAWGKIAWRPVAWVLALLASHEAWALAALSATLPLLGHRLHEVSNPDRVRLDFTLILVAISTVLLGIGAMTKKLLWPNKTSANNRFQFSIRDILKIPLFLMLLVSYLHYGILNFTNIPNLDHLLDPIPPTSPPAWGRSLLQYGIYCAVSFLFLNGVSRLERSAKSAQEKS